MKEPRVTWGDDGFASNTGWELVYVASQQTGEYLTSQEVWISIGTGLPAGAYLDEPDQTAPGKAIVRSQTGWESVDDYRGQTAYDKRTRQSVVIKALGELPLALTLTPPSSPFDVWDADLLRWVKDQKQEDAVQAQQAQQQRQALMSEASQEIAVLTDALDPDVISEPSADDQVKLIAWKTYRVELSKIDQQSTYPGEIVWPIAPK